MTSLNVILNRPNLPKVATTGQYSDLAGTPTAFIPPGALLSFLGSAVLVGYLQKSETSRQTQTPLPAISVHTSRPIQTIKMFCFHRWLFCPNMK
ncbi:hypothetical protein NOV72_02132 [Caballeronia novacaledonica]|uniref:Uncharacterized protein n=1 Tax=Caballeronia novacaledonica TaxID=1544861 RepID=A0A2U3I471_9BURK|nr:hypothetical protein [Caballeronia novacaledonica]SPB14901.1 hypothetical protein NOV72_02132 [Caballeronia novacaledonica]